MPRRGATGGEHQKSFDVFKNKLHERKSWAKTESAKEAHAAFLVLAYNLGWLLHQKIQQQEAIEDQTNNKKREKRASDLIERAESLEQPIPKLRQDLQVVTQLSVKYWRWIRCGLRNATPWIQALSSLRRFYATF